jgi:ADP-L-glycero-D-manno-heptose 6-epimerase
MIVVTGGAGFIGSSFIWRLNQEGITEIVVVDNLGATEKWKNLVGRSYADYIHKETFLGLVKNQAVPFEVEAVVHLGACSATTERDADYLMENNYRYSRLLAEWALSRQVRFVYASSAATYGDGTLGFSDADEKTRKLRPINMYGYSKHLFDLWLLAKKIQDRVAGVKFFNVYGPNEYHKGDMRSVVHKAYGQIREEGAVNLFKSYQAAYEDGGQKRDFIYVKDCVDVLLWLVRQPQVNGIFNLGTGTARTWNDLARSIFQALNLAPQIRYIDMPPALRSQYQYFTQAGMDKLRAAGYETSFHSLEEGITDYLKGYLETPNPYL